MHIKVVFSDTHLLKVSSFMQYTELYLHLKCVNYVLEGLQNYFRNMTLNFI